MGSILFSSVDTLNQDMPISLKKDLVFAHRILAHLKMDDHTYTHLSVRDETDDFFISGFGYTFQEMTDELLVKVPLSHCFNHETLQKTKNETTHAPTLNTTGPMIHGAIYTMYPNIRSIFHLHTPSMVAVSAMKEGLLPLSQWALHFYNRVHYHEYSALALSSKAGDAIARDLSPHKILMLRHHGAIICGETLHEALFYAYHLERACQTQCLLMGANTHYTQPSEELCETASHQLLTFEEDIGKRDWMAWKRLLEGERDLA